MQSQYESGLVTFQQLIHEENKADLHTFEVQIAHGFTVCTEFTQEKIEESIALADSEMYLNKAELKRKAQKAG